MQLQTNIWERKLDTTRKTVGGNCGQVKNLGNRKKLQTKLLEMKLITSWNAFGGDCGNWRKRR